MKTTDKEPVLITIKGGNFNFTARCPLWKAYAILADIERQKELDKEREAKLKAVIKKANL